MLPDLLTTQNLIELYYKRLRSTPVYQVADRIMTYSRRFMFVTRFLKYAAVVITFIETSAVFIVAATMLLTSLPFIAAFLIVLTVADDINGSRLIKKIDLRLDNKRVFVIFNDNESFARSFCGNAAVYVVAKPWKRRFVTAKPDGNLIYVSKAFFIRLRRDYFDQIPEKMVYIF